MEGGQGTANNAALSDTTVLSPDISVTKQGPTNLIAGEQADYTVTVENIGEAPALNVVVTDSLPAGVSYVSANPAPDIVTGQVLTFNLGTIDAEVSQTITIVVQVDVTSGTVTNTVSATTDSVEGGQGTANNAASTSATILSPETMVEILSADIAAMDLPKGTENSLNASLDIAMKVLEDSNPKNDVAAINALEAFINKIEAQRDKKILSEVSDDLIARAQEIIAAISGGT
ncbi:DUF11 domain-containing protein [Chloroflexota bacterium]